MESMCFASQVEADRYILQQRIAKLEKEQSPFWIFNHLEEHQKRPRHLLSSLRRQLEYMDAPVYKLPDVLLAEIFVLCIHSLDDAESDGVASVRCRTAICSSVARFRRVASQTPALWTGFFATLYNFGRPLFSKSTVPRVAMQLDMAGSNRPLTFTLLINELQSSSHVLDHRYYKSAMDYQEGANCRVLDSETIRKVYLKAHIFHLRGELDHDDHAMPVSFHEPPLTTLLIELHLTSVAFPSLSHFMQFLSSSPSLEHITLNDVSWQLEDIPGQISSLPCLQYLDIDIDPQVPNTLLKFLNIANCRTLLFRGTLVAFDDETDDISLLAGVPISHISAVQELAVVGVLVTDFTLIETICALPSLIKLTLGCGIEPHEGPLAHNRSYPRLEEIKVLGMPDLSILYWSELETVLELLIGETTTNQLGVGSLRRVEIDGSSDIPDKIISWMTSRVPEVVHT